MDKRRFWQGTAAAKLLHYVHFFSLCVCLWFLLVALLLLVSLMFLVTLFFHHFFLTFFNDSHKSQLDCLSCTVHCVYVTLRGVCRQRSKMRSRELNLDLSSSKTLARTYFKYNQTTSWTNYKVEGKNSPKGSNNHHHYYYHSCFTACRLFILGLLDTPSFCIENRHKNSLLCQSYGKRSPRKIVRLYESRCGKQTSKRTRQNFLPTKFHIPFQV